MPIFKYKARSEDGSLIEGVLEAKSEADLAHTLLGKGLHLVLVEQNDEKKKTKQFSFGKVPLVEKMIFTKNLAVMIGAGLSLTKALDVLSEQAKNPKFKKIIKSISSDIQKGEQLAKSMAKHKKTFPDIYVSMVKVGETAGNLKEVLNSLAIQMKKDHDIVSRVRGALMYPAIILIAMLIVGTLMMVVVVPSLASTFEDVGAELPASTQFIISFSEFLTNFWYVAIAFVVFLVWFLRFLLKTEGGKKFFDKILLKSPIFGNLSRQLNSARFSRMLSTLVDSGVPIVDSLNILSNTLSNYFFAQSVKNAAKDIQKGKQLNESLAVYKDVYPPLVIQMVQVGEETGALTEIMSQLADFYEEEVDNVTKSLSTIIEPILMIIIGVAVGFFAISMITPMYSVLNNV